MTDVLFWVLFGALAGWIASLIAGIRDKSRAMPNIGLGVLGAVAGGALMGNISLDERAAGLSVPSLLTAVCGAIMLLALMRNADKG